MFSKTYINTFKNLFRSVTFWLVVAILMIVVIHNTIEGYYIGDNDPSFVLDYQSYIQCFVNSLASRLLMYAIPIFTIVSTVLILNRDYGDKFIEIEKAANLKPTHYLLGRLLALVSINFIALLLTNLLCMYWYVFSRGGVESLTTWETLTDIFVRTLRIDLFIGMPCLIFYIGITYLIGTIFKSGIPAAVVSLAYVIGFYAGNLMFRYKISEEYFDYFSPIPRKLRYYFHYYDTEWFENTLKRFNTTLSDVTFCIVFLVGFAAICSVASYFRIRRRTI